MSEVPLTEPEWERLVEAAESEVLATLRSLPATVSDQAGKVPVTFEHAPDQELVDDGIEADTLGMFFGVSYADEISSDSPLPPHIVLYLENIWDFAEGDMAVCKSEVRTTLLHELGHYLGLDEDDLFDRGLE